MKGSGAGTDVVGGPSPRARARQQERKGPSNLCSEREQEVAREVVEENIRAKQSNTPVEMSLLTSRRQPASFQWLHEYKHLHETIQKPYRTRRMVRGA